MRKLQPTIGRRRRARKSGKEMPPLVPTAEDQARLKHLTQEYLAQFSPATPEERLLVDMLIRAHWQQSVVGRMEAEIWKEAMSSFPADATHPLGPTFIRCQRALNSLQRSTDATERLYYLVLHQLERLQATRQAATLQPADTAPLTEDQPSTTGEFDSETPPKKPYLVN
jgi:predicted GNAT family acetyltransferase